MSISKDKGESEKGNLSGKPKLDKTKAVHHQKKGLLSWFKKNKPKKPTTPRGPVTRESLAANRMNVGWNSEEETETESIPLPTAESPRPPMPTPVRKKKGFWLFRFRKPKKRMDEGPAIIINKPAPDPLSRSIRQEIKPMFNSLGWYLLAYLTVYFIYQFAGIFTAGFFDIDSVLYYYELFFPIGNSSPLWSRLNIIFITLAGPMVSVLIAIILFRGILPMNKPGLRSRMFFLWVAYHSATHFLGAFVAGIITDLGFGYVANWMYMNVLFKILVSLVFLLILGLTGYFSARFAMEVIPPAHRTRLSRLRLAMASRYIIPFIIGSLLLIVLKTPDQAPQHEKIMVYDAVIITSMAFLIIPAFFNRRAQARSFSNKMEWIKRPPGMMVLFIALAALLLFRVGLSQGIHFIIHFSFNVGIYQ